jgi:hypothetical protein
VADVVLGAFDGCDPAAPNESFCELDDEEVIEEEDDPPVALESGGDVSARFSARLYEPVSDSNNCLNACWATVRRFAQSWAVGGIRVRHRGRPSIGSTIASVDTAKGSNGDTWHLGGLSWNDGCGWISTNERGGADTTTTCDPAKQKWGIDEWMWRSDSRSRGNNCYRRKSADAPLERADWERIGNCTKGSAIYLHGPTVVCADVDLLPDGVTHGCREKNTLDNLTGDRWKGRCVNWRYIRKTASGSWSGTTIATASTSAVVGRSSDGRRSTRTAVPGRNRQRIVPRQRIRRRSEPLMFALGDSHFASGGFR